jgi:CRISPR-associated protein Cas2
MKCLLIYDIPDDAKRTKIANFCLDYGLERLQYSAFVGDLSTNHQEELMLKIQQRLGKAAGRIDLVPICQSDWRNRQSLCQGMDEGNVGQKVVVAVATAKR